MMNELLDIIDDYIDLKLEERHDDGSEGQYRLWREERRRTREKIDQRFKEAFDRAVAAKVEDIEHQRQLLR